MVRALLATAVTAVALTGCATAASPAPDTSPGISPGTSPAPPTSVDPTATPTPTPTPTPPSASPAADVAAAGTRDALAGDGHIVDAVITIAALGLTDLPVDAYRGRTDDDAGTEIQDRGHAASPHGPQGGVGPGGIGNYLVTGHRTSADAPFARLPALAVGDQVLVTADEVRYTYRIVTTRQTSFRSARSLAEQRAAVPGHPGRTPRRAMITLSMCATPEDHAAGNWWADANGDPEHRIDKIGVLIDLEDLHRSG